MRLFSDACVYRATEQAITERGHDLELARDVGLADANNGEILAHAVAAGRALLTRDMHFSNVFLYPPDSHLGIIVLRIRPAYVNEVHAVLEKFLATTSQDEIRGTLVIIDHSKWRLRKA